MDSPSRDGRMEFDTRFSTPVSELDDHRHQDPIPPVDLEVFNQLRMNTTSNTGRRRSTTASAAHVPTTLLTPPPNDAYDGPIARDYQLAIADDETLDNGSRSPHGGRSPHAGRSPNRRRSRRSTRASFDAPKPDFLDTDDGVAVISRSSSPPNSVDAFAEPRRRERANTAESRIPPDLQGIHRTISGGTHRRRPTITTGSVRDLPLRDDHSPPEDDVCFPQEIEPTKSFTVDFEAIEEFVAESCRNRNFAIRSRRHSFTSSGQNFPGQAYKPDVDSMPADTSSGHLPWKRVEAEDVSTSIEYDEKNAAGARAERRSSPTTEQRFSFFSSEIEQTIHVSNLGDLTMPGESFRDLFELSDENGAWWLDVMNPTEDEIDMFQKAFGIHRLTAEDIEKQETREKVELFKQYYFVSFRSFVMDKEREDFLDPVMVYMIVFRDGILSFSYSSVPHASHVRQRIGKLRNYINLTADWICYALVDDIVDCFEPCINEVERESDQIEDQVFMLRAEDSLPLLRTIGDCRKRVTSLMRLLGGKADVIKGFAKRCNEQYSMTPRHEIGLYLGDIQDHVVTMMSNLTAFEKMLSRSHANYLASLSVDNLIQGNRANEVLSKITIVATILVPMNLITGLFGMNVAVPGRENDSLQWFFGILGVILAFVVIALAVAKKARFI